MFDDELNCSEKTQNKSTMTTRALVQDKVL